MPYLERFWDYALKEPCNILPANARNSLPEASLAASRLLRGSRRTYIMAVAARILEAGLLKYLQSAVTNR